MNIILLLYFLMHYTLYISYKIQDSFQFLTDFVVYKHINESEFVSRIQVTVSVDFRITNNQYTLCVCIYIYM